MDCNQIWHKNRPLYVDVHKCFEILNMAAIQTFLKIVKKIQKKLYKVQTWYE